MGREFIDLFNRWASTYDETVHGGDVEYAAAFARYNELLQTVASKCRGQVLEFGVGTGNLTQQLVAKGLLVVGVEPSSEMRKIAQERLPNVKIVDGDFIEFQLPMEKVDTIVSTYAFHHLTDREKDTAIGRYNELLPQGGRIVFADTVFESEDDRMNAIEAAKEKDYVNLARDLQTEYYSTRSDLTAIFERNGFDVTFTQWNEFVWIFEATKVR